MCRRNPCTELSVDEVKRILSKLSGIDMIYITVTKVGTTDDKCCNVYLVSITDVKGGIDVNGAKSQLATSLAGNPDYIVEESTEESAASVIGASVTIGLVSLGLLLS